MANQPLPWYKTLDQYYKRDEWELFDLKMDPTELKNLAEKPGMAKVRAGLEARLMEWQRKTNDPWQCAPHGILMDKGEFADAPECLPLGI